MSLPVEKRRQWIKSRRDQRKLTKYARLRRQFLRYSILSILLALGLFAVCKTHWLLRENTCTQGIDIKGNLVADNDQIREALRPEIVNTPLLLLNPNELENRVKRLGAIKHTFVRRYVLPAPQLKVEVLEEFPWATLYSTASSANNADLIPQFVIAESGRLISIHDFPNVFQPSLKIYSNDACQMNLNTTSVEHWANWISYISNQVQSPVIAIDMRQPNDVKVQTGKFILALGSPDSGLTRRLYRLSSVLEVLANQHKEPAYVNLGLNSNIPVKLAKRLDKIEREDSALKL